MCRFLKRHAVHQPPQHHCGENIARADEAHRNEVERDAEEFALRARPFCLKAGLPDSPILDAAIATVQTKVQTLAEVPDKIRFFFELGMDPEAVSKVQPEALELLFKLADRLEQEPEWDGHELISVLKAFAKENGVKMGAVMFPARVALTGLSGGPDLSSVFSLLGREETVRRIRSFSLD